MYGAPYKIESYTGCKQFITIVDDLVDLLGFIY